MLGTTDRSDHQVTHRQVLTIFAGLMLGMLLAALDHTILSTALPTITGELGGLDHLSWVITSYMLASTVSTPLYGKLGDLFGRKRLFQVAIAVFLAGSVLSGASQSMAQLIASRAVQGLGAGGLIVLAQAIIAQVVSPRERGRYQGYFGAVFGAASIAGPLLGGFFTDHLSWRWVFYVNIPLGLAALAVTTVVLPAAEVRGRPRVDYAGSALLAAAVTCLVLVTTWGGSQYAWGSPPILALLAAAVVLLIALLVVERRAAEPVVPVHLFSVRSFKVATGVSFILGIAMFGSISFLPLFLQVVQGASATSSGLLLLPFMLGLLAASTLSGQAITRTGRYKAFPVAGTGVSTVAMLLLSLMDASTSRTAITAYMVLLGVGLGLTMQTLVLATQNEVRPADLGVATSSVSFFRSMGGSLGVALFGALFNHTLASRLGGGALVAGEGSTFTPESITLLPPGARGAIVSAFSDGLTDVFRYSVPLLLLAFAGVWLLKEVPLLGPAKAVDRGRELSAGSAPGTAEPDAMVGPEPVPAG